LFIWDREVEFQSIDFPKLEKSKGKTIEHGAILKIVPTNIAARTSTWCEAHDGSEWARTGTRDTVRIIDEGQGRRVSGYRDLVSVPFNVACGRCRTCRSSRRSLPEVNPSGAAYGYVDMALGGRQAEYVLFRTPI